MNWFEALTGFTETDPATTRSRLAVEGRELVSRVDGRRHGIGELELPSLAELRRRVASGDPRPGALRVQVVDADVRALHARPDHAGSLFQVASQFNLLEMTGPSVVPEDGVTRYAHDLTQGPACAIAAGAATIYRNNFVPVGDQVGQTRDRQLDTLADLGDSLSAVLGVPRSALWDMRNGYALCTPDGLAAIERHLAAADAAALDGLRARLRIGLHWDVEVTDARGPLRPTVSQAFCSALPIAYSGIPAACWERFARLVLEAAYEATLLAGLLNAARGRAASVLLTRLGGGAFGNDGRWIDDAMSRALALFADRDLDVRVVTRGEPSRAVRQMTQRHPTDRSVRPPPVSARIRTSATHPLRIDAVAAGAAGGAIGITFCPGKCGPSVQHYTWARDLDADLDVIAAWGPKAVVTLIEDHEFEQLKVPDLGPRIRARGIDWYHLPIVDLGVPDVRFERWWREAGPRLRGLLEAGGRVLVHCRGGLGRAGTIAARLLTELGETGDEAVTRVRAARPGAIETKAQQEHVIRGAG